MLPAHRKAHRFIWIVLAVLLPLILASAAVLKPSPLMRDAVKIEAGGGAAKR